MTWKPLPAEIKEPEPLTLRDAVKEWAREFSAGDVDAFATILREWPTIVGADVAAHVFPHTLRDGELIVDVDDPAWVSHVGFLGEQLKTNLNGVLGEGAIGAIKARLDPTLRRGRA